MASCGLTIETYHHEHRCGVARIVRRLGQWFEPDAWQTIDSQLGPDRAVVATDDRDQVVGFIVVTVEQDAGRIAWAGVDPDCHRMGVGRAMMEMVTEEAEHAGLRSLRVETMSEAVDYEPFARTRAFYAAMGFEPVEELGDRAGNGLATTDWVMHLGEELVAEAV